MYDNLKLQSIIGDANSGNIVPPAGHQHSTSVPPAGMGSESSYLTRGVLAAGDLKTLMINHLVNIVENGYNHAFMVEFMVR